MKLKKHQKRLVTENAGLVGMVVGKLGIRDQNLRDELMQMGHLALIRAAQKFKPDLGFKFSTYAINWIRAFVSIGMRRWRHTIWVPELRASEAPGWESPEETPEVADRPHPYDPPPGLRLDLEKAISRLPYRSALVIRARYLESPRLTLQEIGKALGLCKEGVRQIELKALKVMGRDLR